MKRLFYLLPFLLLAFGASAANTFVGNFVGSLLGASNLNFTTVFTISTNLTPADTNSAYVKGVTTIQPSDGSEGGAGPLTDASILNGRYWKKSTLLNGYAWYTNGPAFWYAARDTLPGGATYLTADWFGSPAYVLSLNTNADVDAPFKTDILLVQVGNLIGQEDRWIDYYNSQPTTWQDFAGNNYDAGHFSTNPIPRVVLDPAPWALQSSLAAVIAAAAAASAKVDTSSNSILSGLRRTNNVPSAGFNDYVLKVPPMMWSTYNVDQGANWFTEVEILKSATNLVLNGYFAAGWNWISIDDGWEASSRDGSGDLQPSATKFPRGMAATVTDLHTLGFKVQIYTSYPGGTCFGLPGTGISTMQRDLNKFASWGCDGVFFDSCGQANPVSASGIPAQYEEIQVIANAAQHIEPYRPFMTEVGFSDRHTSLGPNEYTPSTYGGEKLINLLNVFGSYDFHDGVGLSNEVNSASTVTNAPQFIYPGHSAFGGRMGLNGTALDARHLMTCQIMCHFKMLTGYTNANPSVKVYMTNTEAIAIGQDPGWFPPTIVAKGPTNYQIWKKPLGTLYSGSNAVAIFNWGSAATNLTVSWAMLGISSNTAVFVRDAWAQTNCGTWTGFYSNTLPANSLLLLVFTQLPTGITNGALAGAGVLGETISSAIASGSATSLTTATAKNITSLSLTAGDWDVSGNVNFVGSTATASLLQGGISATSATVPTDGTEVFSGLTALGSGTDSVTLPRKQINVAATTTVYLVGKSTFSAGSVTAYGSMSARRIR